jgi:hypothetical protein
MITENLKQITDLQKLKARQIADSSFDLSFTTNQNGLEIRNLTYAAGNTIPLYEEQKTIIVTKQDNAIIFQLYAMNGNIKFALSACTAAQIQNAFTEALGLLAAEAEKPCVAELFEFAER